MRIIRLNKKHIFCLLQLLYSCFYFNVIIRLRMENFNIALAIFGLLAATSAANNENRQVVMLPAMPVAIAANASDHWSMDYDLMMSDGGRRGSSMPSWARRYTKKKTGCPCWWDMTLGNICACCKNYKGGIGQPCGYPKHNYCQRKRNIGCPGMQNNYAMNLSKIILIIKLRIE